MYGTSNLQIWATVVAGGGQLYAGFKVLGAVPQVCEVGAERDETHHPP